ncbi:hypothetical protein M427DRAFT_290839 [Gonapodya prolifera JEL478]|uniref:Uncharacterized protein n=1 Tax=Gonapodya prolifera (strain JEL478) TaxID=1344416 RepID=A0A139AJ81_GONPJ|nr:hypothetical protein M427DRAFT_290839 [Gonapodya prolifera JEL478]|eukprot:KXS16455.1 hypothetical protein M427DRAFT_290839 [Gonapodya prolifera JEL478]
MPITGELFLDADSRSCWCYNMVSIRNVRHFLEIINTRKITRRKGEPRYKWIIVQGGRESVEEDIIETTTTTILGADGVPHTVTSTSMRKILKKGEPGSEYIVVEDTELSRPTRSRIIRPGDADWEYFESMLDTEAENGRPVTTTRNILKHGEPGNEYLVVEEDELQPDGTFKKVRHEIRQGDPSYAYYVSFLETVPPVAGVAGTRRISKQGPVGGEWIDVEEVAPEGRSTRRTVRQGEPEYEFFSDIITTRKVKRRAGEVRYKYVIVAPELDGEESRRSGSSQSLKFASEGGLREPMREEAASSSDGDSGKVRMTTIQSITAAVLTKADVSRINPPTQSLIIPNRFYVAQKGYKAEGEGEIDVAPKDLMTVERWAEGGRYVQGKNLNTTATGTFPAIILIKHTHSQARRKS